MASSKEYLDFILEQLSGVDGITHKQMMGDSILYMNGRIIGGIYDDRFLVKPTKSDRNGILLTHCELSGCHFVFLPKDICIDSLVSLVCIKVGFHKS